MCARQATVASHRPVLEVAAEHCGAMAAHRPAGGPGLQNQCSDVIFHPAADGCDGVCECVFSHEPTRTYRGRTEEGSITAAWR